MATTSIGLWKVAMVTTSTMYGSYGNASEGVYECHGNDVHRAFSRNYDAIWVHGGYGNAYMGPR